MIIAKYDPVLGIAIPDGVCDVSVTNLIEASNGHYIYPVYSTENIFEALRLAVAEGRISHYEVMFVFEGVSIAIDQYGRASYWPKGFCAYTSNVQDKLMDIGVMQSRKE